MVFVCSLCISYDHFLCLNTVQPRFSTGLHEEYWNIAKIPKVDCSGERLILKHHMGPWGPHGILLVFIKVLYQDVLQNPISREIYLKSKPIQSNRNWITGKAVVLLHKPDIPDVPDVPPPKCDFLINIDPYRTFSRFI
jgi:hypothetical protein